MPYIKPEQRKILEKNLSFLAKKAKESDIYTDKSMGPLDVYGYICTRLAIEVMPEKRYAVLSATRAIFFDAADEWCRRMNVAAQEPKLVYCSYPFLNKRIAKLV